MRLSGALSASLSPLTPAQSHLQIEADAQSLTHGCNTCHGAHEFNPEQAAVEGCLTCHADNHSQAFKGSPAQLVTYQELRKPWPAKLDTRFRTIRMTILNLTKK